MACRLGMGRCDPAARRKGTSWSRADACRPWSQRHAVRNYTSGLCRRSRHLFSPIRTQERHSGWHSFGGSVIQKVVEQFPDRIKRLVFLDAFVLEDKQCVFDNLPSDYIALFNQLAAASADNTMLLPWEIWRDCFIQDAPEAMAR